MAFNIDSNGNITIIQGDSGNIFIEGISQEQNYTLYFAVQDEHKNTIGNEISINTNKSSTVVIELTGEFTNLLKVPNDEPFKIYFYGIKLCSDTGLEDTLLIGNSKIGDVNTITVFPKKVEGA